MLLLIELKAGPLISYRHHHVFCRSLWQVFDDEMLQRLMADYDDNAQASTRHSGATRSTRILGYSHAGRG